MQVLGISLFFASVNGNSLYSLLTSDLVLLLILMWSLWAMRKKCEYMYSKQGQEMSVSTTISQAFVRAEINEFVGLKSIDFFAKPDEFSEAEFTDVMLTRWMGLVFFLTVHFGKRQIMVRKTSSQKRTFLYSIQNFFLPHQAICDFLEFSTLVSSKNTILEDELFN